MESNPSLLSYFVRSLKGAWELIKLNPRGLEYFDASADGYWKSFWAIILVAPVFFVGLNLSYDPAVAEGHKISKAAHILNYLLQLPLVALVMVFFTRFLRIDAHYVTMIVAYNWLWVLLNYIILPLSLVLTLGIIPEKTGLFVVGIIAMYLEIYVAWFMFKHALKISTWLAIGVTAFETLFSLSVMQVLIRVF